MTVPAFRDISILPNVVGIVIGNVRLNQRFLSFSDMKDNARMAKIFEAKPESETLRSIVLGTVAMFLQFFGYLALGIWMRQYSALWANLMIAGAAMYLGLFILFLI